MEVHVCTYVHMYCVGGSACMHIRTAEVEYMYCLDSGQPLSCLGSSVVEHLPSKQYVVGSSPT